MLEGLGVANLLVNVAILVAIMLWCRHPTEDQRVPRPAPLATEGDPRAQLNDGSVAMPGNAPEHLRPDPTAVFNVFRLDEHGALALGDVQRYSGNDRALMEHAKELYAATPWHGTVYVFQHTQLLDALPGGVSGA